MLISIATLMGFKSEIQQKIRGVQGDFIVDSGRNIESGEPFPIEDKDVSVIELFDTLSEVESAIPSTSKACVIKSNEEIEGLLSKGLSRKYLQKFEKSYNVKRKSNVENNLWCWISETTAKRLHIDTQDAITVVYFVKDEYGTSKPRARKLYVSGIFQTGIDKIDAQLMVVDIEMLKVFLPEGQTYTQIEIWKKPTADEKTLRRSLLERLPHGYVRLNTLQEYNRLIFDWLAILNTNVWIILVLMALVSITGMSTTILILIIERTNTVGLLLAMGATYQQVARLFRWQALFIATIGIVFGNLLALGIIWVQNTFELIQLNQEVYFIPSVKFQWSWWYVTAVNLVSLWVIAISLWIPSRYIKRVDLIKAIQFK